MKKAEYTTTHKTTQSKTTYTYLTVSTKLLIGFSFQFSGIAEKGKMRKQTFTFCIFELFGFFPMELHLLYLVIFAKQNPKRYRYENMDKSLNYKNSIQIERLYYFRNS